MSPCDIPFLVRIFLMLSPSFLLINIIIAYEILHFQTILYYNSSVLAAKQNQKFPFHFLSAPPTPPAEENKKGKENFWFLPPRPKGADEACRLERTIQFQATTRSAREISSFRQGSARNAVELCSIHTAKVIFEIKYCPVRLRIKLRRDAQFHK